MPPEPSAVFVEALGERAVVINAYVGNGAKSQQCSLWQKSFFDSIPSVLQYASKRHGPSYELARFTLRATLTGGHTVISQRPAKRRGRLRFEHPLLIAQIRLAPAGHVVDASAAEASMRPTHPWLRQQS